MDPSFAAFKKGLLRAAERGDLRAIREALASAVLIDFESVSREDAPAALELHEGTPWNAIRDALKLGAVRIVVDGDSQFVAPYIAARLVPLRPEDLVIVGQGVNVRATPAAASALVERLTYDVVAAAVDDQYDPDLFEHDDSPAGAAAWAHIVTSSGRSGYVYGRYIRSASGTRFRFGKFGGVWRILAISRGD